MSQSITIHKCDPAGQETWQYSGEILAYGEGWVNFEAWFNIPGEKDAGYTVFRFNDRFVEWCYSDRWYNVAAVYDVRDDRLKGWYCNLTRPALLTVRPGAMSDVFWSDLALDVWVDPHGGILILDEDEYAALDLDNTTDAEVQRAVTQIRTLVATRAAPFDAIAPA